MAQIDDVTKRRPRGQMRADILDATISLLREVGDGGRVSIDAVVQAAGCTPPTLYYYFDTKDELLAQACRREYERFEVELQALAQSSDGAGDALFALGEAYLRWARANPAQYRLLFMTPLHLATTEEQTVESARETPGLRELASRLDDAKAAGAPIEDVELTAFTLWAIVHGFASLSITEPAIPEEMVLAGFHFAVRNLFVPPSC